MIFVEVLDLVLKSLCRARLPPTGCRSHQFHPVVLIVQHHPTVQISPPPPSQSPRKSPGRPPPGKNFALWQKFFPLTPRALRPGCGKISRRGLAVRRGRATFAFAFGRVRGDRSGGPGGAAFVGAWRCEGPAGPGPGGPGAAGAEEHKRESIISKGEFDPGSG